MANVKITDLTAYTDPLNTDVLAIVDVTNNVTKKVSIANLAKNVSLGTAALPGVAFDGDPNTGIYSPGADQLAITTGGTVKVTVDASGNVNVVGNINASGSYSTSTDSFFYSYSGGTSGTVRSGALFDGTNKAVRFYTDALERGRFDGSGRLLVGTPDGSGGVSKLVVQGASNGSAVGVAQISYNGLSSAVLAADTDIGYLRFTDQGSNSGVFAQITASTDGTTGASDYPGRLVFSTTADGAPSPTERMRITNAGIIVAKTNSDDINIGGTLGPCIASTSRCGFAFSTNSLLPTNGAGALSDNAVSLGLGSYRWSTVYAGTGTINTSDANLKQDIDSLSTVELTVATQIKSLIKKFRFRDAVEAKGDDARIHVGVIAQDVAKAFVDAGLDPYRYGLFCEDELEDGSKRLGIRYDELLAFVISSL